MQQYKQLSIWDILGNEEQNPAAALPCDKCVFNNTASCCAYETEGNYCVDGDKMLLKSDGWHLVDDGRDIPHNKDWQLAECITYYQRTDKYNREKWLVKDSTFKSTQQYKPNNTPEVIAWRYTSESEG
jgi:hypothetical protein